MGVSLKLISNGIEKQLQGYVSRANALEGYLNRVVTQQIKNFQARRWMTENSSEGTRWHALEPGYAARKRREFKSYPGAGTKILVATDTLRKSVTGSVDDGYKAVTTPRSLTVTTSVKYAGAVDEQRTFSTWSRESRREILDGISRFLIKNQIRLPRAF